MGLKSGDSVEPFQLAPAAARPKACFGVASAPPAGSTAELQGSGDHSQALARFSRLQAEGTPANEAFALQSNVPPVPHAMASSGEKQPFPPLEWFSVLELRPPNRPKKTDDTEEPRRATKLIRAESHHAWDHLVFHRGTGSQAHLPS